MSVTFEGSVVVSGVGATLITYFGQDDGLGDGNGRGPNRTQADAAHTAFRGAMTGVVGEDSLESLSDGQLPPIVLNFSGAGNATLDGGGSVKEEIDANADASGRFPIAGTTTNQAGTGKYYRTASGFFLSFDTPVGAIGFYAIDLGDFGAQLRLRFTLSIGGTIDWEPPHMIGGSGVAPYGGSVAFVGVFSTVTFTRVDFLNDSDAPFADVFGFDVFTVASAEQAQFPCGTFSRRRVLGDCADSLTDVDIIRGAWRPGDTQIINRVIFSVDWDNELGDFTKHLIYNADDSIKKYGLRPALTIPSKGIHTDGTGLCSRCTTEMMDERAFNVFARYADPPPLLEIEAFYRKHKWEAGDLVCVTSRFVPNLVTGERGLDDEIFEIVNVRMDFAPEGKVVLTLLDVEAITLPKEPRKFSTEDDAIITSRLQAQGISNTLPSPAFDDMSMDDLMAMKVLE